MRSIAPTLLVLALLLLGAGCAGTAGGGQAPPEPPLLTRSLPPEPDDGVPAVLTLPRALALALMRNPRLRSFSWEVRAREARILQASLPPNPELSVVLEDFGGTGQTREFKTTETTVEISQLVLLAGKRAKRVRLEELNTRLAGWDYEALRLEVYNQTTKAFIDVLALQERLRLLDEIVELATKVHDAVAKRVEAGQISPIEEKRARLGMVQASIERDRTRRQLSAARARLAASWGDSEPTFETVRGRLDAVLPVPPLERLLKAALSANPDLARWADESERRRTALRLAEAARVPDPVVSVGYRRLNETDDSALTVGLSIPLPIADRNQGGVLEARYRIAQLDDERASTEAAVTSALVGAYEAMRAAWEEIGSLTSDVLPGAEAAYEAILEGYRQGKFRFLDVLDAQRTLFEARLQYNDALARYQRAAADVERLTATPLGELAASPASGAPSGNGDSSNEKGDT